MGVHDGHAASTLDRIRVGSGNLVLVANQRVGEIKKALDHGRFEEAYACCASLHDKLGHLAGAESRLARLADASIVRVADMEVGMVMPDAGVVSSVEACSHCGRDNCENVTITFENGSAVTVDRDEEMVVAADGP